MKKRPLIPQDYADHWSEEPRSIQYQKFLIKCRNSLSQDKNLFNPEDIFNPLEGESRLKDTFNYKYKYAYINSWENIQKNFEACLRRNNPKRDNIVDCWNDEIIEIEYFQNEIFYKERWEFFKIEYEELVFKNTFNTFEEIINNIKIFPISTEEKIKAKKIKYYGWNLMVKDWIRHRDSTLPNYSKMTKQQWLESERISEVEFASAERYVRNLNKHI